MLPGLTLGFVTPALAAELTFVVETMEQEKPGIFGKSGAYGQVFALFTCALATATMLGPLCSGFLKTRYGWNFMSMILGVFSASGAIPVVCATRLYRLTKRKLMIAFR